MKEKQTHILIADDEKNTRLCLCLVLKSSGFKISSAENGAEALDKLLEYSRSSEPVDLLISDIKMPGMDGLQFIRRIKELGFGIPVIVITGFGDNKVFTELIELGIRDILEKPFGNKELCRKVQEVFEKQADLKKISDQEILREKNSMVSDLQRSIDRKEFTLYYQPVIALESNDIVGIEALVRWLHPRKGMIQPADFIPLAEETGLIIPLGAWILGKACDQIAGYSRETASDIPFMLGINVSPKQLLKGDPFNEILSIVSASGINPQCVNLEITESLMMRDADIVLPVFEKLKQQGIRLAIDDFGTGYSSLSYLHQFPFDILKIDRSFVSNMGMNGDKSTKIIQAILCLASNLGMDVIAEGIETEHQLEKLKALDCRCGQGFYFSKPLAPEDIGRLLKSGTGAGGGAKLNS